MAETLETKKHPATQLRRRRADDEGIFPRSQEWSVALTWLVGIAILQWGSAYSFGLISKLLVRRIERVEVGWGLETDWYRVVVECVLGSLAGIVPVFAGLFCIGMAVHFAQAGFRWKLERLVFDWGRVSPRFANLGGASVWVGVVGGLLKLALVVGVIGWGLWSRMAELVSWSDLPLSRGLASAWMFLLGLGWWLGLGWLVLAGLDYGWNWWLYEVRMRMTDSELREELKESQGDPSLRSRRRRLFSGG